MQKRSLGPLSVLPVGLGCMSLSHAYGTPPPPAEAARLLRRALDLGYDFFDTAALYGFGGNEKLLGETIMDRRDDFVLASKCGMRGVDGKREINGRPDVLRQTCEESLKRLRTDVIDLYYLHRLDKNVPIEDSIGALADLVRQGKVRAIGVSEVSAATLRRAHAVHPIAAVQSEYSLWTRNPELGVLDACRELGVTFVAFSPVGRGFLAGGLRDPAVLAANDLRRAMPRFQGEHFAANLKLLEGLEAIAGEAGVTPGQASLAWLLARHPFITVIPGTTNLAHLEENWGARTVRLAPDVLARLDQLINQQSVSGPRYSAAVQAEIDTEEFA
jgi:aryl-alcohol dehydrogenase-like predicted oxidoreductase